MMLRLQQFFAFGFILVALACSGSKKLSESQEVQKPKATWIDNRPLSDAHYIGIASVSKQRHPLDYAKVARSQALQEMSSEISVQIQAESVLQQFEKYQRFQEDYKNTVSVYSNEFLEGYEQVDIWENETEYWVYYRISKSEYEKTRRKRIKKSIDAAMELYKLAIAFEEEEDVYQALLASVRAIDELKEYLNEPLQTNFKGRQIFVANEINNFIGQMVKETTIKTDSTFYRVTIGDPIHKKPLEFRVVYKKRPVAGIPVSFEYSDEQPETLQAYTNEKGLVYNQIPKLSRYRKKEKLRARVDFKSIVREATPDPLLHEMLDRIWAKKRDISFIVSWPPVFISADQDAENAVYNEYMAVAFKKMLQDEGFYFTDIPGNAHYIVSFTSKVRKGNFSSGFYSSFVDVNIDIINNKSELVYQNIMKNIKGVQLTPEQAIEKAYEKAAEQMETEVANEFIEFLLPK